MDFATIHTLNQFNLEFETLKTPSCLPICLEDMCAGWTIDSFQQVLSRITMKNTTTVPLFYQKPEEMICFSNKIGTLNEVFKLFDTRGLSRIETLELVVVVAFTCSGNLLKKLETIFNVFSVSDEGKITKDGFACFLDVYVRGLCKCLLRNSDTFYPKNPNFRLAAKEIELVTNNLFRREEKISAGDLLAVLNKENKETGALKTLFFRYPALFQKAQEEYRDLMAGRAKVIPFIKSIIIKLISVVAEPAKMDKGK
jgi:hypothetical protein